MSNLSAIYNFLQRGITLSETGYLFLFIIAKNYRLAINFNLVICIFEKMRFLLQCGFTLRSLTAQ